MKNSEGKFFPVYFILGGKMAKAKTPKQIALKIKQLKKQVSNLEKQKKKLAVVKKKVVKRKPVRRKPVKKKRVAKKKAKKIIKYIFIFLFI